MPGDSLNVTFPLPHVALIALNRPQAANALHSPLAEALAETLRHPPPQARAAVLTGQGRHFCAGADLKERRGMDEAAWEAQHALFRAARDALLSCPVPVIAAVNGAAMGGGLELALACDFIYAADTARFALPEAALGIMPGMGGTQTLPRAVGERRARELLLTGRAFSAAEAYEWGMLNRLCPPETLLEEALNTAAGIAANAPLSVRAIRRAVAEGWHAALQQSFAVEMREYAPLLATQDRREGINAFNEKRAPEFRGG